MANSLTTRGTLVFGQKEYVVRVGSFRKGQMALRLEAKDAEQSYRQEPKRITYNMGNWSSFNLPMPKNCSFVDVVRHRNVETFLKQTGLAKPYVRNNEEVVRNDGNEWYPVYQFDPDMLSALDAAGYSNYSRTYDAARVLMEQRLYQQSQGVIPVSGGSIVEDPFQL